MKESFESLRKVLRKQLLKTFTDRSKNIISIQVQGLLTEISFY